MRWQHALRRALAALGCALLLVAALIFILRWLAASNGWTLAALASIPLAALLALLLDFARQHFSPAAAALKLDARAGSSEHLVTWWELRQTPDAQLNPLQQGFKAAQRGAALKSCAGMNCARLLPMRFPSWGRALWLAELLVLCALLAPRGDTLPESAGRIWPRRTPGLQLSAGGGGGGDGQLRNEAPRIEPLSPTEVFKLKLELSAGNLAPEEREKMLRELKTRIGDTPLSALPQDLQDVLNILDKTSVQKKDGSGASKDDTSAGKAGGGETFQPKALPGIAAVPENLAKAFTTVREHYPDVERDLDRYYRLPLPK